MSGLSNLLLIDYISPRCKNFIGVFSVDNLPSNHCLVLPCCLITNLSKSNEKGTHFVAIYISSKNQLFYFDSFGFLPPIWNKPLLQFLKPWLKKNQFQTVLDRPIQNFNSLFCGWYCAAFCLIIGNKLMSIKHFIQIFEKKLLQKNDLIVTDIIKEIENTIL